MVWHSSGYSRCSCCSHSVVSPFKRGILIGGVVFLVIGMIIFMYGTRSLPK